MQTTGYTQQGLIRLRQKTSERDKKERKKKPKDRRWICPRMMGREKTAAQQFLSIREIEEKSEMGSS